MEYLGIFSVIALLTSLIFVQVKWGPDYSKTFSRLVARHKASLVFYFVTFAAFLSLFSIYIIESFIPKFGLPSMFLIIYTLGVAAQRVCVSVPETGDLKTKVHLIVAAIMSMSVFAQVVIVVLSVELSGLLFAVGLLSLVIMLFIWLVIIFRLHIARFELALQSVYFLAYLGTIVLVGYLA